MSIVIGILIAATALSGVVATVRALRTDGYRPVPTCPDARRTGLQ
ncbi:hypothetical protein [Plantibacter flavus]